MLNKLESFCQTYAQLYDAVVFVSDFYELSKTVDPFRPVDPQFQSDADVAIRGACKTLAIPVLEMPTKLTVAEKVRWVTSRFMVRGR